MSTPILSFSSLSGETVYGAFVYECIGVYTALVFSIILSVILFEGPNGLKMKIAYSIVGILGTFALHIVTVTIIFLADYFHAVEVGTAVHYVIS